MIFNKKFIYLFYIICLIPKNINGLFTDRKLSATNGNARTINNIFLQLNTYPDVIYNIDNIILNPNNTVIKDLEESGLTGISVIHNRNNPQHIISIASYNTIDDINNAGGIYTDLPAVIDSGIITTAHYKDMGPWMKAVLSQYYKKNS